MKSDSFLPRRTRRARSSELRLSQTFVSFVLFVVNGFFICSPEFVEALDKIRIGMGAFSPSNSAIWVAEERGFFKKHGLDAEAIFIGGGAARGINALLA